MTVTFGVKLIINKQKAAWGWKSGHICVRSNNRTMRPIKTTAVHTKYALISL
jgi:hypothetical protein